jgi:hypothetical protein
MGLGVGGRGGTWVVVDWMLFFSTDSVAQRLTRRFLKICGYKIK